MAYSKETQRLLLRIQQSEMTEAAAYHAMASSIKDGHNRETLGKIADEIAAQAHALEKFTDALPQPDNRKVRRYARMARVFGFTFAAKLMDKRKVKVEHHAKKLLDEVPEVERLEADEHDRDEKLFDLLSEKRLSYVGAMILGMNDAIVEITGTLAGSRSPCRTRASSRFPDSSPALRPRFRWRRANISPSAATERAMRPNRA